MIEAGTSSELSPEVKLVLLLTDYQMQEKITSLLTHISV